MSEWISVNERLPEEGVVVDVWRPIDSGDYFSETVDVEMNRVPCCKIMNGDWYSFGMGSDYDYGYFYMFDVHDNFITHWRGLVEPPMGL